MLTYAMQLVRATLRDRAGVSSIEYGVLALGVIAAVVAGVSVLSTDISSLFISVGAAIQNAASGK
jgi:Flp pilus assembly pilin Flp